MRKKLKFIKLFEKFQDDLSNKIDTSGSVKFSLYTLNEDTDDSGEAIDGIWKDREEAIEEAESHQTFYPDTLSGITLSTYEFNIPFNEFLDILSLELEGYQSYTREEIEIEMVDTFINDYQISDYFEYVKDESDIERIRDILRVNDSTNDMIDELKDMLNSHVGRNWRNGFGKYTSLYKDEEGNLTFESDNDSEDYEPVSIRIGDHTHNPRNGHNDLNVIIANDNKTAGRYYGPRTDLSYTSDDSVEDIFDEIINFWK